MTDAPRIGIRRISETYARLYLGEEPIMFLARLHNGQRWMAYGPCDADCEIARFASLEDAHDFAAAELARHPHSLLIREAVARIQDVAEGLSCAAERALSQLGGSPLLGIWAETLEEIEAAREEIDSAIRAVPLPPEDG